MLRNGQNGLNSLARPEGLAVHPSGQFLYASSLDDGSIVVLTRDTVTGALTPVQVVTDGVDGVTGLTHAYSLAFSPGGEFVYATSWSGGTLAVFAVDALTGRLTFLDTYVDNGISLDGLDYAASVVASPDGRHVYTTGRSDSAIGVFRLLYDPNDHVVTVISDSTVTLPTFRRWTSTVRIP